MSDDPVSTDTPPLRPIVAVAIDLALVLAFCAIGRASHEEAVFGIGFLVTAWPFVAGLAVGTALNALLRRAPDGLLAGSMVFCMTLLGGMFFRALSGQGTAPAFVIVAMITLLVFLMGWRMIVVAVRRSRAKRA